MLTSALLLFQRRLTTRLDFCLATRFDFCLTTRFDFCLTTRFDFCLTIRFDFRFFAAFFDAGRPLPNFLAAI